MGLIQINASELTTVRDDGFLFHALGSVGGEANPSDFLTFSNLLFEGGEALVDVAIEIVPGQFALDEARLPFLVAGSLTASSFTIDLGPIGFAPTNTEDFFYYPTNSASFADPGASSSVGFVAACRAWWTRRVAAATLAKRTL
ncbi:MAG: hypothetical protein ABJC87_04540 [Roseobacter sp.]